MCVCVCFYLSDRLTVLLAFVVIGVTRYVINYKVHFVIRKRVSVCFTYRKKLYMNN